jgi:transcriptional activator SPT7
MDNPPPPEPVTLRNISSEIGIVQEYFLKKLHDTGDPLVEDDELPAKQRFPKPRLPPTGKISSPRKRPLREQAQMARKKRKLEEGKDSSNLANGANGASKPLPKPVGKLKFDVPMKENTNTDPEKDDASATGMMSPESMEA